jgi:hypothetical protein
VGVALAAPERDPERLADGVAGAVVVGVGMGQRVGGDTASLELAQDAPASAGGARVDQYVADQVDVDGVARAAVQAKDVRG